MEKRELVFENVIENISDGILTMGMDGTILLANPSATKILGLPKERLIGRKIAKLLLEQEENDDFFQCLLDAVYSKQTIVQVVPYFHQGEEKRLRVVSSFLESGGEKIGLIVTFGDLTALVQLSERNEALNKKLTEILDRFVQVMIGAIEARTPYNANHTKSMVRYGMKYLDWLEQTGAREVDAIRKPFLASVWLHDVGKLVVPRSVMDKATRLGARERDVLHRIEIGMLCEQLRLAKEPALEAEVKERIEELKNAMELVKTANVAGFLTDDLLEKVEKLRDMQCLTADGNAIPLLNEYEVEALSIRRGTLTRVERKIVESHVVHTREMLEQMGFSGEYEQVSLWAGEHHEYLDGSGYPAGLQGEALPWETRLLTILDIYDSLTADDRPYKPAMTSQRAFQILEGMSVDGKLDGEILKSFYESKAWEKN
ncbi:MAG: PAS domain S-box protein [Lachnospiraceae bacterium]|nr:PAS domain S-box protein [Lachnospiraceae bacterium]